MGCELIQPALAGGSLSPATRAGEGGLAPPAEAGGYYLLPATQALEFGKSRWVEEKEIDFRGVWRILVTSHATREKEDAMGFPTKVQLIDRQGSQQWYINFPSALAQACEFLRGEVVEWVVKDKSTLILRRSSDPAATVEAKTTVKKKR